jgi:hypothetical protein
MLSQAAQIPQVQIWPIDRLVFYARNPRKNDAAVDRMCASIHEYGFKNPGACPQRRRGRPSDIQETNAMKAPELLRAPL